MQLSAYLRLDQPDASGRVMVQWVVTWNGQRVRFSTGQKLRPDQWDERGQRVLLGRQPTGELVTANRIIGQMESAVRSLFAVSAARPTKPELNSYVARMLAAYQAGELTAFCLAGPQPAPVIQSLPALPPTPVQVVQAFEQEKQSLHSDKTVGAYVNIIRHLTNYNPDAQLSDLSTGFIGGFLTYLSEEMELQNSTVTMYLSRLHSLCTYAERMGVPVHRQYHDWPSQYTQAEKQWHPEAEVERIVDYGFADELLQLVSLCYAFACYTGLRVSDLSQFDPRRHLRTGGSGESSFTYLSMAHQQKTRNAIRVALSPYAQDILARSGGELWPREGGKPINVFKYIRQIKKAGKLCAIDQPVDQVRFVGSRRIVEVVPKYRLMSSHTARHSYACNSLLRGMDLVTLQNVLGHRSIASTMAYARITEEHQHRQTLSVWSRKDTAKDTTQAGADRGSGAGDASGERRLTTALHTRK